MRKNAFLFLGLMTLLFWSVVSFAQEVAQVVAEATPAPPIVPPETVEEATKLLPAIIDSLMTGKYLILGALVVMLATLGVRQYLIPKWNLSTNALPWVAVAIAFLNGVAAHVAGGMPIDKAAQMILISGGLAAQIWSLGGKALSDLLLAKFGKELAEPIGKK